MRAATTPACSAAPTDGTVDPVGPVDSLGPTLVAAPRTQPGAAWRPDRWWAAGPLGEPDRRPCRTSRARFPPGAYRGHHNAQPRR